MLYYYIVLYYIIVYYITLYCIYPEPRARGERHGKERGPSVQHASGGARWEKWVDGQIDRQIFRQIDRQIDR